MRSIIQSFYHLSFPPLLPVTISFILGIWWQSTQNSYLLILCSIALAILLISIKFLRIKFTHPSNIVMISLLAFPAGAWLFQHQIHVHQNFYKLVPTKPVSIVGTVKNIEITKHLRMKGCITIHMHRFKPIEQKKWHSINKIILLYTNTIEKIQVADTIAIHNLTFKPPQKSSYQSYLIKEKIAATVYVKQLSYTIDDRPSWSLHRWIYDQQQRILTRLEYKLSHHAFTFFSSLFLGNRTRIKDKMEQTTEQFKKWGISHFLARSGLHLAIFILIWYTLLCLIPLSFGVKQTFLLLLGIIYFLFTWTSVSFMRAFALFILYKLCHLAKKPFHFLHFLTAVCLCFLIINPIQLFFLDFQLSFALTFALAWLNQLYRTKHT